MLGRGTRASGGTVAIADIGSGSAGVAIVQTGTPPRVLALAREFLPLEGRADAALKSGVVQALSTAGDKALAEFAAAKGAPVSSCYCVIGAPWSRSFAGGASQCFERPTAITDAMIGELAKQALADQKDIDRANLLEATVVRVLLNGYPTAKPKGKRAVELYVHTLASDCDQNIKAGSQETLARLFPGAPVTFRSSARGLLSISDDNQTDRLMIETSTEISDVLVVRKGVLAARAAVPLGARQLAESFAKGKPAEETLGLLDMLEKDQCENESCDELKASIAKAEPELAKQFGETFATLSAKRKLPEQLVVVAPSSMNAWMQQFFSRVDFTQFTATTRPFSAVPFSEARLASTPEDPRLLADAGLSVAYMLVNTELSS